MRNLYRPATILLITLVFASFSSRAQSPGAAAMAAADSFGNFYNTGRYARVFALFSAEMQGALPEDKTVAFLTGLKSQAGSIVKRSFARMDNGAAVYRTEFEAAVLGIHMATDPEGKITGLYIRPFTETTVPTMVRNTTPLRLPFKGEWTVIWGGDTKEQNYHVESPAQKNAFDLVMTDSAGNSFRGEGVRNEDYYAFGKELLAPCDAEVVLVVDGVKDNVPGTSNPVYVPGNTVVLKTAAGEYLLFAHFKQHTILVRQGQKVKTGAVLGRCGNTGNSSEPHLHFHIMNTEEMVGATGIKAYFARLRVNGVERKDYSPVQKDKISD